jgi:hypothetical protein
MRNHQKDSKDLIHLLWIGVLCVFSFIRCTKSESDTPYRGQGIQLYKWTKSYQYNSLTGIIDTIRPSLTEDSVFIFRTGYISVFKGERLIFRANVLDRVDAGNDYFACGVLQSGWSTLTLKDSSSMSYRDYGLEPLTEIRFGSPYDDYSIDYGCERVDLYDLEILEF